MIAPPPPTTARRAGRWAGHLYVQVLAGVALGMLVGALRPSLGEALRPLGDGFLRLIRMLLAPIIFGTIVVGIARTRDHDRDRDKEGGAASDRPAGDLRRAGRIGLKALLYFELVSTLALVVGLVVVNLARPGAGMNVDAATLDMRSIAAYTTASRSEGAAGFLLDIIPSTMVDALVKGQMLQVILVALLFGVALARLGGPGQVVVDLLDGVLRVLFGIVRMVMRLAPVGAFGAMAFTVGKYGFGALGSLARLVAAVYLTSLAFVVIVLGGVARLSGFSLWRLVRYLKDEILIVFATSSTEVVLPRLMTKLERLGCSKPLVGMVLPIGYTFNADGTAIYLTMAAVFLAQATNTPLALRDQIALLAVMLLTSKGSAGVAGAGFVTLAATLASLDKIPAAAMVLLVGVDRFINEARAVTNVIGNGVATLAIARWEGELDQRRARLVLEGKADPLGPSP